MIKEDWSNGRYSRQVLLPEFGPQGQECLSHCKVLVVGCGALGTHIADTLARAGVGHLYLVDRDLVELNNLQRQVLFDETDVGRAKAEAAAAKLGRVNSQISIHYRVKDIHSQNIEEMVAGMDLVMDATDNVPTRMLVNDACVKNQIPWIYGGVIQTRGMVMNILPDGPCLRCILPDVPPPGAVETCESVGVLNVIASIVASLQCAEAFKILMKKHDQVEHHLISFNVWQQKFEKIKVNPSRHCLCCSGGEFTFLDAPYREMVNELCSNSVQIIPPPELSIDLESVAGNLKGVAKNVVANAYLLKFEAEGKSLTIFSDGRAIIKGTGDTGAAKAIYSRYLGL